MMNFPRPLSPGDRVALVCPSSPLAPGALEAAIAATSHELEAIEKALASIRGDPYYLAVDGKYIQRMNDEEIAEKIHCDPTTVWRNRKRLIQRLAVRLYGVDAVK